MKKRATSLLLTLFLLLLGFNTAFAAPSCSTTFSKTNFAPKTTGATYYELNEVLFSEGISTEMSAALNFVKDTNPARGKYTVSGNKLSLGCVKNGSLMSITIPNLKSGKTYSISITGSVRLRAKESDASEKHRTKFKLAVGNSDKYFENSGSDWTATGPCNMSLEFTATSSTATALLTTDYSGDCYILDITEIKVVGCYDPQIVSSAGDLIPKGNPCTFSAIGLTGSITWKYIDEAGVTHPLSGNGNSVTIDNIVSGGEIVATGGGTSLSYKFLAIISCSEHADKLDVVNITFKMPGSSPCRLDQITDNDVTSGNIRLSSEYCYGYFDPLCKCDPSNRDPKQESLPSGKGPTEEHYVIAKSTQGMFPGWTQNEVVNSATNDGSGFMIVNCGQQIFNQAEVERGQLDRGKICEFTIRNLCPDTWYDFSAQVRDIDQNPNDLLPTNVRFVAIGANNEILLNYPTGSIPESWVPKGQSFNTKTNSIVKLILYNNQEPNTTSCDIPGSDLGLDNIKFTRCIPKLGTFSNQGRTEQGGEICNNRNDVNVTLYSGHSQFGITDMINSPYYIFLKSKNGGKWEIVNSTPINDVNNGYAELTDIIASDANDAGSKYQYTSVVAGHTAIAQDMANYLTSKTPSTYESDRKNYKYTGTGTIHCYENLYAFSEKLTTYTVVCANPCTPINKPETIDFTSCVKAGTKQFYELIKNPKFAADKYVWEKEGSTASVPATFDTNVPGNSGIYKVKSIKHTHTDGVEYCESDWATVQVTISTNVPIVLSADGETYGPNETYKICLGSSATLIAQVDAGYNVDWTATPADPNIDVTTIHTNNITVTPTKTTTYTADASGSCYQQGSITIELTTAEKPVLKADEKSICLGSPIKITDTITETAEKYEWSVKKDNGSWETITNNVKNLENYTPSTEGKYSFKSKAINGQCEAESDEITVEVGAPITFTTSQPTTICEGSSTIISVSNINPSTANVQWFDEDDNKVGDDDGLPSVSVSPKDDTKYKVSLWIEGGCKASDSVTITVDGKIEAAISADKDICIGDKTTLSAGGGTSYSWIPSSGLSSTTVANPVANPEKTTKYTVTITKGKCSVDTTTTVTVHELPVIETITITEGETYDRNADVTITKGTAPYSYSLNGEDYYDVPSEILNNVPIGWNLLYVKDKFNCESTKEFYVEPIPVVPAKYFTPNEDGVNDKWTVKNLDAYDSYIVEIFDRYGKRLYIKRVGSFKLGGSPDYDASEAFEGWDGIYNGHPMPSDDYWYLITVEEIRKQYTGHFTLKR